MNSRLHDGSPALTSKSPAAPITWRNSLSAAWRIAAARLRFFLLLGAVLAVVAGWPFLRDKWDRLTSPGAPDSGVSPDTEYWCPMCPGVESDWPGKCPVCHMSLVVRQKGEMTPLPDGVVARMQFPPYRVQLAGIHTSPVAFRPLVREVVVVGLLEPSSPKSDDLARLVLAADILESDVGVLKPGQPAAATSAAFPGQTFPARVAWLAPEVSPISRSVRVWFDIDNPRRELRAGMLVETQVRVPLAELPYSRELFLEQWRDRTTVGLLASVLSPSGAAPASAPVGLLESAAAYAALQRGLLPAAPADAVIDTGTRKVVFLERAPGLFDAVEVRVGRRCGEFVPVLSGLELGQAVVTAGAFLLDAETRLNPAAAAAYFGASSRASGAATTPRAPAAPSGLSAEDQRLAKQQNLCPVTGEPLDSMGGPVRVVVEGRTVFVCCEGCTPALKKSPGKYLVKLPK